MIVYTALVVLGWTFDRVIYSSIWFCIFVFSLLASLSVSVIAAHFLFYFFSLFSPMSCVLYLFLLPCPMLPLSFHFPWLSFSVWCTGVRCNLKITSWYLKEIGNNDACIKKYTNYMLSVFAACRQQHFLVPKNEGHFTSFLSNQLLPLITYSFIWSLNLLK